MAAPLSRQLKAGIHMQEGNDPLEELGRSLPREPSWPCFSLQPQARARGREQSKGPSTAKRASNSWVLISALLLTPAALGKSLNPSHLPHL